MLTPKSRHPIMREMSKFGSQKQTPVVLKLGNRAICLEIRDFVYNENGRRQNFVIMFQKSDIPVP